MRITKGSRTFVVGAISAIALLASTSMGYAGGHDGKAKLTAQEKI